MNPSDYPTKYNLLQAKQSLRLAMQGYDLMDKKRRILLTELRAAKKNFDAICAEADFAVHKAYEALEEVHLEMGRDAVERIRHEPRYSLAGTTASLDEAFLTWQRAKKTLVILFGALERIHYLTQGIRKAQKKAAALGNVTIPTYEARIRYIQSQLEERTRDELARLKAVKSRHP
ncbi:MAG: V-type ATP synthase subunit D [Defluviitaleaceae bacterium]|nr:V-type ATP synthase subunit D [Defluviitaleaceae bacterium]